MLFLFSKEFKIDNISSCEIGIELIVKELIIGVSKLIMELEGEKVFWKKLERSSAFSDGDETIWLFSSLRTGICTFLVFKSDEKYWYFDLIFFNFFILSVSVEFLDFGIDFL